MSSPVETRSRVDHLWLHGRARVSGLSGAGAWLVWAAMTAGACGLILAFGCRLPMADEVAWLDQLTGKQPVTLSWLWSQHNEHRMFVPRLIYLALLDMTGERFHWAALYNAAALSAASALLMCAARRLRGTSRLSDAVIPLALLHWAHQFNLVWVFQLNFVTSVALAAVVLWAIVRGGPRPGIGTSLLVSSCLVLMVLCGAYGMAYAPAMCVWLMAAAVVRYRQGGIASGRTVAFMVLLAVLPVVVLVGYFTNYQSPNAHPSATLTARLEATLQFLCVSTGHVARQFWPLSGVLILALLFGSLAGFVVQWHRRPDARMQTLGLACFLGGILSLALGIGWGRAGLGPGAAFEHRYYLIASPVLCLLYLQAVAMQGHVASRFAPDVTARFRQLFSSAGAQRAFLALLFVLALVNSRKGLRYATEDHAQRMALERDIRDGVSETWLARRHPLVHPDESVAAVCLAAMRNARLGVFQDVPENAPLTSASILTFERTRHATGWVRLESGGALRRRFSLPAEHVIARIDVPLNPRQRKERLSSHLVWTLRRVGSHSAEWLAQGTISFSVAKCPGFMTLRVPPFCLAAASELELVLEAPTSPAHEVLELPAYPCETESGAGFNAFVYLCPASVVARQSNLMHR